MEPRSWHRCPARVPGGDRARLPEVLDGVIAAEKAGEPDAAIEVAKG
jgi:hypothetical protein